VPGGPPGGDGSPDADGEQRATDDERASLAAVTAFYGRWARFYDLVARYTPGVGSLRSRAADALALSAGDTVVDVGCGTGANLPHLRERVGPAGRVVGLDVTGPMLDRARRLVERRGWSNVHLLRADGARLPLSGPVDAVLGTFVVGMFRDPAAAVEGWCDVLAPGGRVALLDAARSERRAAWPVNVLLDALTVVSAPPTLQLRYDEDVGGRLTERVERAREALDHRTAESSHETALLGLVRVASGRVPGGPER